MSAEVDFWSWGVPDLKTYLRVRGVSCSILRKRDLVRLCSVALELKLEILNDIPDDYRDLNQARRTVLINGKSSVLNDVATIDTWSSTLTAIPDIEQCDILIYFLNSCGWSEDRLKNYKHDSGYKLYLANHINDVLMSSIQNTDYLYIKATCVPETRQRADPYNVWILLRSSGEIKSGGCTCVADNGTCKHCVACLFALANFCERHKDRHTAVGTDNECKWDQPRKQSEPVVVSNIDIRTDDSSIAPIKATPDKFRPTVHDMCISEREIEKAVYGLCVQSDSVMLQILDPPTPTDSDESDIDDIMFINPPSLEEIAQSMKLASDSVCSIEGFIEKVKVTYDHETCVKIEEITRGQSDNDEWFKYRKGLITASNFASVLNFKFPDNDKNYILQKVMGENVNVQAPSLLFGRKHEPIARQQYVEKYRQKHKCVNVKQCGLLVDTEHPYVGASPDGIVTCKCCGKGLLEIKSSYMYQHKVPHEVCEDEHYHLYLDENNGVKLKYDSAWYTQIQGQLGVSKLPWCDFVFFTKKGIVIDRILFDPDLYDVILVKSRKFFEKYVYKALMS